MQNTMETAVKSSRKRKGRPPPPSFLVGSLTRQKSQKYFFHHNRSGKSRISRSFSLSSMPIPQKVQLLREDDDGFYDVPIKDLRAHRVFSKPLPKNVGKSVNPCFDSELIASKSIQSEEKPSFLIAEKCGSSVDLKDDGENPIFDRVVIDCESNESDDKMIKCGEKPCSSIAEKCGSSAVLKDNVENPSFDCVLIDCEVKESDDKLIKYGGKPCFSIAENCGSNVYLRETNGNPDTDCVLIDCELIESDGKLDGFVMSSENTGFSITEKCSSNVDLKESGVNSKSDSELVDCEMNECVDELEGAVTAGGKPGFSSFEECDSIPHVDGGSPNVDSGLVDCKFDGAVVQLDGSGIPGEKPGVLFSEKCGSNVENGGNPDFVYHMIDGELDGSIGKLDRYEMSREKISFSMSEKCASAADLKGGCLKGGNPNLLRKCGSGLDSSRADLDYMSPKVNDNHLEGKKGEGGEGIDDEDVQTTPPDAVVLARPVLTSPTMQTSPSTGGSAEGRKGLYNHRKNMASSRRKVFKAPNLFSYRRLLPYLMDMAKEEPSESKNKGNVMSEMNVDEKPFISPSQECVPDNLKLDEKGVSLDAEVSDLRDEQVAAQLSIDKSTNKNQTEIASSKRQYSSLKQNAPEKGNVSHNEQISSDKLGKMGNVSPIVGSNLAVMPHNLKTSPEPSGAVDLETSGDLGVSAKGETRTTDIVLKRETSPASVFHSAAEAEESSGLPVAPSRGILKRNPRGCRGICDCLNCSSFRLNAEKSFEFSRNQLLDAEELASDLIQELSGLRGLLEKSSTGATDVAAVPDSQVQEACSRASNLEAMARTRLRQMSEDLYVHCRTKPLQRPNVRFK